jgi:hypothetical protein
MTQVESAQIRLLSEKIDEQNEKIEHKNDQLTAMKFVVDRIEAALLGDKFNEHGGVIKRLESVEQKQDEMHDLLSKYKWTWKTVLTIAVSISGIFAFIYYATSIIKNLIK